MKQRLSSAVMFVLFLLATTVAQADYVSEGWDDGIVNGWLGATGVVDLNVIPSGGYSGGYLMSTEPVFQYGIIGALNYRPEYSGDFLGHGYVRLQVAVKFLTGTFSELYFHVRYLDSSHNGWQFQLAADFESRNWQQFTVNFNPRWSDVDAQAAGWSREYTSTNFIETMANVYSTGIKARGTGDMSMGIDEFSLKDQATAATISTWSEVKALYR
jgi:hypothetical protein